MIILTNQYKRFLNSPVRCVDSKTTREHDGDIELFLWFILSFGGDVFHVAHLLNFAFFCVCVGNPVVVCGDKIISKWICFCIHRSHLFALGLSVRSLHPPPAGVEHLQDRQKKHQSGFVLLQRRLSWGDPRKGDYQPRAACFHTSTWLGATATTKHCFR